MSADPSGPSVRLARGQETGFMQPILRKALPLLKKNEQNKTKENTSQNDKNLNSRYRMGEGGGIVLLVALQLHLPVRGWFWVLRTSLSAEALCHSKTLNVLFRVESSLLDSGKLWSSTYYHH